MISSQCGYLAKGRDKPECKLYRVDLHKLNGADGPIKEKDADGEYARRSQSAPDRNG